MGLEGVPSCRIDYWGGGAEGGFHNQRCIMVYLLFHLASVGFKRANRCHSAQHPLKLALVLHQNHRTQTAQFFLGQDHEPDNFHVHFGHHAQP